MTSCAKSIKEYQIEFLKMKDLVFKHMGIIHGISNIIP